MELFDGQLKEFQEYVERLNESGEVQEFMADASMDWPSGNKRNLVLSQDMAVELGNPREGSFSFMIWGPYQDHIQDGRISLIGPDLTDRRGKSLPFGKVILVGGREFTVENAYERYREMEGLRYDIDLKGYMMRAVSQYQREWSRVSIEAVENGFNFRTLGSVYMNELRKLDYISAVEIFFITRSKGDVSALKPTSDSVGRIIGAMNKMIEELSFDCDTCEYTDVCASVADLRQMRNSMKGSVPANE